MNLVFTFIYSQCLYSIVQLLDLSFYTVVLNLTCSIVFVSSLCLLIDQGGKHADLQINWSVKNGIIVMMYVFRTRLEVLLELFIFIFLAFDFCRFCVVVLLFHPGHNGQWPPTWKDFYTRSYQLHYYIFSTLNWV